MIFRYTILFQLGNPLKTTREVEYVEVDTLISREIQEPGDISLILGYFWA